MRNPSSAPAVGLSVSLGLVVLGACRGEPVDDPWASVPRPPPGLDHAPFFTESLETGPEVTRACLECHEEAAREVMATTHWTWKEHVEVPGRDGLHPIGKATLLNNFCIGVQPNLPSCTSCHVGYGWRDETFDFEDGTRVDCLVCHDQSRTYAKGTAGLPLEGIDLAAAAASVGRPSRANCGMCHFDGGGGDAVKHGDLDQSLLHPSERLDVHMGRHDFVCVDCHRAPDHDIHGRSMSVSVTDDRRVTCTDCHAAKPHRDRRLDGHGEAVACPTCHIPFMAVDTPTKMTWDWSQAGQDRPEDPHHYLKRKGTFSYASRVPPEYRWYNGLSRRHLPGDPVDPDGLNPMNDPLGTIADPTAKIWPFKVHRGRQPFDVEHGYFIAPKTAGPEGYWTSFDWVDALEKGAEAMELSFSGRVGFAATEMYWPVAHMVSPKERALGCDDCHGPRGRLDWGALGYGGDPAERGARRANAQLGMERDRGDGEVER